MKIKEIEEELIGMKLIGGEIASNRTVGYMRGKKVEYKMLLDARGRVARLCRVRGMPIFYLLGPDGDVLWSRGALPAISLG
jgi:hypothetical protein